MIGRWANIMGLPLLAPLVCLVLLAGLVAQKATHLRPQDVEPYHASAKAAIEGIRYTIGYWAGKDDPLPPAAQRLLKPNALFSRTYIDNQIGARADRRANLMIVQCRDTGDMLGHYPPVCYVAHGDTLLSAEQRDWRVGDMTIGGMEYRFSHSAGGHRIEQVVYNFLIIPRVGIVRDMKGVARAADDYQQRFYGAAQFQVVTSGELPREQRDDIFQTLIGPNLSVIRALISGGSSP